MNPIRRMTLVTGRFVWSLTTKDGSIVLERCRTAGRRNVTPIFPRLCAQIDHSDGRQEPKYGITDHLSHAGTPLGSSLTPLGSNEVMNYSRFS